MAVTGSSRCKVETEEKQVQGLSPDKPQHLEKVEKLMKSKEWEISVWFRGHHLLRVLRSELEG